MFKRYIAILGLFFFCCSTAAENRLVIINATLIDALNPTRLATTVIVENGKIQSILSASDIADIKETDIVVDAQDKFLIPGLWDAHVHLTFIPELDFKTSYDLFLSNGITSIRDTGAVLDHLKPARDYAANNSHKAPRLFFSGPLIDGIDRVYRGMEPGFPELSIGINEVSDIEKIVDDLVAEGATFLKSYEMLSRSTYLKLLQIARQKELKVTGHIPLSIDLLEAIEAGLGGMQHIRNLDLACAFNSDEIRLERQLLLLNNENIAGSALRSKIHKSQRYAAIANFDKKRCDAIIQQLAINEVFQTPTLTINSYGAKRLFADPLWRETYQFLPDAVRTNWQSASIAETAAGVSESAVIFNDWSMRIVGLFNQNGVKILAGTDTPIGYLTPGFSLHKELELLVQAGLSPTEALRAATVAPAEFFNLESEMGTLDVGKLADIVILNNNPLTDIRHTQDIYRVISKGVIY
jgi:hypothetical protein